MKTNFFPSLSFIPKKDFIAVVILVSILSLLLGFYAMKQPRIKLNNGRGDDGVHYAKVAEAFLSGNRPQADAPFVYRIGTPLASAILCAVFKISIDKAFFVVNLITLYVLSILAYAFFRMYLRTPVALGLSILFLLPFHAPPRWLIFYPVLVDNLWSVFILSSMIVMSTSRALTYKGIVFLTIATFLATLTREVGLLIPVVLLMSLYPVRKYLSIEAFLGIEVFPTYLDSDHAKRDLLRTIIPLAFGLMTSLAIRNFVSGTGEYGFLLAAYKSLHRHHVLNFTQTLFVAFGPLLVLLVVEWRSVVGHLRNNPAHTSFLLLILALTLLGGVNTIRFLYWGFFVVFLLIGIAFQRLMSVDGPEKSRQRTVVALLAVLVLLQVVNTHFWHGFYDDYTAWLQWGGLYSSDRRPVYIAFCLIVSTIALIVFRQLRPHSFTVTKTTAK